MELVHYYHCYAAGLWRAPVEEHLSALARIGYNGPFHLGLIGSHRQRAEALKFIAKRRPPDSVAEGKRGWEQLTLRKAHEHALEHPDGVTLYAHTKGAANPGRLQEAWRRSMSCALLSGLDVHAQT